MVEYKGFCPVCGGDPMKLGILGKHYWMRCRDCGIDFLIYDEEVG